MSAEMSKWIATATKDALVSGVGCPCCTYEGPYWVEPCRLHAILQEMAENAHLDRQISDDQSNALDELRDKLGLAPEDDPVARLDDVLADAADAERYWDVLESFRMTLGSHEPDADKVRIMRPQVEAVLSSGETRNNGEGK